jgi:hypothetical protein
MPLMISRIGHSRGQPVAQGFGKCGTITRHSASVRLVWYRLTGRLCCCRVVGVHMANPRLALQRGDQPDYDGLLELFPLNYHEPYYRS